MDVWLLLIELFTDALGTNLSTIAVAPIDPEACFLVTLKGLSACWLDTKADVVVHPPPKSCTHLF